MRGVGAPPPAPTTRNDRPLVIPSVARDLQERAPRHPPSQLPRYARDDEPDPIVLDANPLENIRNSESVRYTIVNGRVFDAATMNEIGNHPRTRQPFSFIVAASKTRNDAPLVIPSVAR